MPWLQITLDVERDRLPLIEAVLANAGALAVTLGDAADEPQLEPAPGATPMWHRVRVSALFPDNTEVLATLEDICRSLAPHLDAEPRLARIPDRAWERVWLADFVPTRFGRRLWVCPRGQTTEDPDAIVIELDPGLAFGTGRHPTTALCLRWLEAVDPSGKTVLDYGCGSGILAIAALRLGAERALAVDHDPQAIEATLANAEQNAVADRLLVYSPEDVPDQAVADLVLANILAATLVELAPRLAARVHSNGFIALSGILEEQTAQVAGAYEPWFELDDPRAENEWILLCGRRRN